MAVADVPFAPCGYTQFAIPFFRPCRLTRLMRTCSSCSTSHSKRAPMPVRSRDSVERAEARNGRARCARTRRARRSSGRRGVRKIKIRKGKEKGRANRRRHVRCLGTCKRVNLGCRLDSFYRRSCVPFWSIPGSPALVDGDAHVFHSLRPLRGMMMGERGYMYIYTQPNALRRFYHQVGKK